MTKNLWVVLVVLFVESIVHGGTVRFDPATVAVDVSGGATSATLDVYADSSGTLETFNSIDLLIGANVLTVAQFTFDADFESVADLRDVYLPPDSSPYESGIAVGAFAFEPISAPIFIGTLVIDTSGVPLGAYMVLVDSETDGGFSALGSAVQGSDPEPLSGAATVQVFDSTMTQPPPEECTTDADCGPPVPCATIACVDGTCQSAPVQDCRACSTDADCDDANPCSDESCNGSLCQYTENTAPCDDGDPCTTEDTCSVYTCAGTPIEGCDSPNGRSGSNGGTGDGSDGQDGTDNGPTTGLCGAVGWIPLMLAFLGLVTTRRHRLRRDSDVACERYAP